MVALVVVATFVLAGCAGDNTSDTASGSSTSTSSATTPAPPPQPVVEAQVYQQEHMTVMVGNPTACNGLPPASGLLVANGDAGNGVDSYGFTLADDSIGLAYNFTAGSTGQELQGYGYAFLDDQFNVVEASTVEPGKTASGIIPEGVTSLWTILCAGGSGAADFVSYVQVQVE